MSDVETKNSRWPVPTKAVVRHSSSSPERSPPSGQTETECTTGARVEVRGLEKIPKGPLLVVAKHQSAWETIALLQYFDDPTFILKRELLSLPLFGWYLRKTRQIPIDRGPRIESLRAMNARSLEAIAQGRQILIFAEGTRRPVGAPPDYKMGAARLYATLKAPCLPVALTSGLAWPRNTFLHYPRKIILEFMDVIPAGMSSAAFFQLVSTQIEERTNVLLVEAGYVPEPSLISPPSS